MFAVESCIAEVKNVYGTTPHVYKSPDAPINLGKK
jgi:hypothetical protein